MSRRCKPNQSPHSSGRNQSIPYRRILPSRTFEGQSVGEQSLFYRQTEIERNPYDNNNSSQVEIPQQEMKISKMDIHLTQPQLSLTDWPS